MYLYLYFCLYLCLYLYSICSYDDHVCASLPGPPLRARCLQSKMQIHDRVSGFSRKIEQIIALAPLVTNPLEKLHFFTKKISPSSSCRLHEEKDSEGRVKRCALPNQSNSSESAYWGGRANPFWRSGFGMVGKNHFEKIVQEVGRRGALLTPIVRWRQHQQQARHNRQTVYFQSITLLCTNTSSDTNAETNTCIRYKYIQLHHRQTRHIQCITLRYISLDKPAHLIIRLLFGVASDSTKNINK